MNNKELLEDEISRIIEKASTLDPCSKEHTTTINSIVKLYNLKNEENKIGWEFDDRYEKHLLEKSRATEQTKDRYFKLGMDVASMVIPIVFYSIWMNKGFKFEETGTFTSTTFRGLFNRFRPTGK